VAAPPIPLADTETLPRLTFVIESAEALRYAAAPTLSFALAIESDKPVRSLALSTQIRIVPTRRTYDAGDTERLVELFGTRERWGDTLRSFLWTNSTLVVPPFEGSVQTELPVSCTYDLEVAAAKYFHALADGDVPLEFLFSGTVFYLGDRGLLRTAQIPWESESQFRLPVRVFKQAIDNHFPGSAWLRLRDDVYDRLVAYKAQRSLPTWEATMAELLDGAES
jgi:Family of unknown function (DUF6084)